MFFACKCFRTEITAVRCFALKFKKKKLFKNLKKLKKKTKKLTGMPQNMICKMLLSCKIFSTYFTTKWSIVCVRSKNKQKN